MRNLLRYQVLVLLTESISIPGYRHPYCDSQVLMLVTEPISIPIYPYCGP